MDMNSILTYRLREINYNNLEQTFKKCSIYDYRCMLASGELVLLLGCGVSEYQLFKNLISLCFK